jgi:hypothetical protein
MGEQINQIKLNSMDYQHRRKTTGKALSPAFVYNTNISPDTRLHDRMIRCSAYRNHSLAITIHHASATAPGVDPIP